METVLYCQMNKMTEAIDDCSKAIELDDKYTKAYLRRAKWYVKQLELSTLQNATASFCSCYI